MVGGESPLILPIFFPALLLRTALQYPNDTDKEEWVCWMTWVAFCAQGGGYSAWFLVTGMIEGFLGVWNFRFRDFFWAGKFCQVVFSLGLLDLSRDFLGIQNDPKIRDSYIICCFLEIFMAWKFVIGFFWEIFWGFVWSPKDFFGFWFLPPFDHPCHLKCPSPLGFCDRYYSNKIGCLKPFRNH